MASEEWYAGKSYGRGELAKELLRNVRWEQDGRMVVNVNATWLREVAKLGDESLWPAKS